MHLNHKVCKFRYHRKDLVLGVLRLQFAANLHLFLRMRNNGTSNIEV